MTGVNVGPMSRCNSVQRFGGAGDADHVGSGLRQGERGRVSETTTRAGDDGRGMGKIKSGVIVHVYEIRAVPETHR